MTARPSLLTLALSGAIALLAGCGLAPVAGDAPPAMQRVTPAAAPVVDVVEADIATLARGMQRGDFSSEQLVRAYLQRVEAMDDAGPTLGAVIELNPRATAEAAALDAERRAGHVRGTLHGIPVLLKDNIDAVGMANSGGSLALADNHPSTDAPLVAALRKAGAVILGKTNLSEWANFRSTRSISGWSGRGGQTRNPYALDRSPCGSSSGTGTAVAASLAAAGVGTETDGSILCPSSVAGLVGLKPTVGLVSRTGIIPISSTQDTAGPMARTVADAAVLLGAMASADARDPATAAAAAHRQADYTGALKADALRGARIGVMRAGVNPQPEVDAAWARSIEALEAAGATVVEVEMPTAGRWDGPEFDVLKYEFKDGLERYLREHDAPVKTLAELMAFNREHADREMPWFGQELLEQSAALGPLTDPAYRKAVMQSVRLAGPEGIDALLEKHHLDALVTPTTGPAWLIDPVNGDSFTGAGYGVAAVAGYPSLTVPMGDARGLPVGLAFIGAKWSEAKLLGLGYAFEQRTKSRKAPTYPATLPLP